MFSLEAIKYKDKQCTSGQERLILHKLPINILPVNTFVFSPLFNWKKLPCSFFLSYGRKTLHGTLSSPFPLVMKSENGIQNRAQTFSPSFQLSSMKWNLCKWKMHYVLRTWADKLLLLPFSPSIRMMYSYADVTFSYWCRLEHVSIEVGDSSY